MNFPPAGVAQMVERHLAKVNVAGSSPVSRSLFLDKFKGILFHPQLNLKFVPDE